MSWDKKPSTFVVTIEGDLKKFRNKAVLLAHRSLVFGSAVDTGRYRGNHQITINAPAQAAKPNTFAKSPGIALSKGQAELAKANNLPYATVWISNNLDYAMDLELHHREFSGNYARAFNNIKRLKG